MTAATLNNQGLEFPTASGNMRLSKHRLLRMAVAFAAFLGGFVIREPAPYELWLLGVIGVAMLFGLRLGGHALLLLFLFAVFNLGGMVSMFTMDDPAGIPLYLAVSAFLGLTAVFWCAIVVRDVGSLRIIFRAYVVGAVCTSFLGIIGYFGALPGFELFTRYDRAMGAFKDPNVFGPFLILPLLYLIYGVLYRGATVSILRVGCMSIILFGLFLSFSRGAWGTFTISASLTYVLLVATETRAKQKLRLIIMAGLGVAALVLALLVALQFDAVREMFEIRAKVVQDYDGGKLGRFDRHWIGFAMAMVNPLGIGALEFGMRLGEDTHNIWVKALMAYGWMGFVAWFVMTLITVLGGARILGRNRPWRPYLICAWSTFVAHLMLAWVIDVDHWRHIYFLIGIIWGCMAVEQQYQRRHSR